MSEYETLLAAGRAHIRAGRLDEALTALDAALRRRPDAAAAYYLRGEALFLQRRIAAALDCHAAAARCAAAEGVGRGDVMSGMVPGDFGWMSYMLRGDFASAWRLADSDREYRLRAGITGEDWPRHMRPIWDGRPLDRRHVLVRCYHGLGDTLHFIRYAPLLAERAAAVCVEAQPELLPLLRHVPGIAELHALSGWEERPCGEFGCDAEIDVTELPHAFGTTVDTIPAAVPYLRPEPALVAKAARRIAAFGERRKVGIVWAAGAWKPERSIPLACLGPLAQIPWIALIALQRGPAYEACRRGGQLPAMLDGFGSDDIGETAALIANLDLVITVDTMAAHLVGALGAPVWLLLHFAADWRWLLDRADSPWYPTMRLFRQPRPGDWDSVAAEVAAALAQQTALPGPRCRAAR